MSIFVGAGDWVEKTVSGATTQDIDLPAGAQAGDMCIVGWSGNSGTLVGTQTGFTTILDKGSTGDTLAPTAWLGRRTLNGTDIANGFVTLGSVPSAVGGGGALVFREVTTTQDFTAVPLDKTATSGTFSFGSVVVSQGGVVVVYFVTQATNGTNNFGTPGAGWTETGDRVAGRAIAMGYRIFSAAETGTISLSSTGTVRGYGLLVGFRSAVVNKPTFFPFVA